MPERTADQVQHDIEHARDALAAAVDQLATRANPKRLADEAKDSLVEKAKSPVGLAVLGGVGLVVALLVVRRARKGRSDAD